MPHGTNATLESTCATSVRRHIAVANHGSFDSERIVAIENLQPYVCTSKLKGRTCVQHSSAQRHIPLMLGPDHRTKQFGTAGAVREG